MTKYDCVDCKRPVEILVPEENICTDCYINRLKLQIIMLSSQKAPAMLALLERWSKSFELWFYSKPDAEKMKELSSVVNDTKTLLKEAKGE